MGRPAFFFETFFVWEENILKEEVQHSRNLKPGLSNLKSGILLPPCTLKSWTGHQQKYTKQTCVLCWEKRTILTKTVRVSISNVKTGRSLGEQDWTILFDCHILSDTSLTFEFMNLDHVDVSKNRGVYPPKWMVKIMENLMNKWMIWGVLPPFLVQHPCSWGVFWEKFHIHGSGVREESMEQMKKSWVESTKPYKVHSWTNV